ncbi:uncharacterized protein LAJ45_02921 [Morchella importuna]|uniref:uncharacterized protein n=1 Tax=Morchella importuna TaxID=1174673 RepID=UPI001E8D059B|nr:uncharacterized protein LAJ45_02921 [Morchella importuna]KAH8153334.1 hypothetical protein LAJ45_02921 [Morchella importuna]
MSSHRANPGYQIVVTQLALRDNPIAIDTIDTCIQVFPNCPVSPASSLNKVTLLAVLCLFQVPENEQVDKEDREEYAVAPLLKVSLQRSLHRARSPSRDWTLGLLRQQQRRDPCA